MASKAIQCNFVLSRNQELESEPSTKQVHMVDRMHDISNEDLWCIVVDISHCHMDN